MSFDEEQDDDIHGECAAEIHRLQQELKKDWIPAEDQLPEKGRPVDIQVNVQRPPDFADNNIIMTGWLTDHDGQDCWAFGNDMLLWDYDFDLGVTMDDVICWRYLPKIT